MVITWHQTDKSKLTGVSTSKLAYEECLVKSVSETFVTVESKEMTDKYGIFKNCQEARWYTFKFGRDKCTLK